VREDQAVSRRVDGEDRIWISIGDLDESRCGGTHVTSTGEIGLFKIVGLDDKVVRYETGSAAARNAVRMGGHALEAAHRLGLERTAELPAAIEALIREREQAEEQLESWKQEVTERQLAQARQGAVQRADGVLILFVDLSHLKARHAREMVKKDLANVGEVWICLGRRGNVLVASGSELVSARETVEQIAAHWNMRAGGNTRFAQGGPFPQEVGSPLEQIAGRLVPKHERSLR
jgi:alanyl-tRNA synthetase